MHYDYARQLYFNLQTAAFTGNNSRMDYDLAFDAQNGQYLAWLNGSRLMMAARTGISNFDVVNFDDTLGHLYQVEFGHALRDSNAIGNWYDASFNSRNEVYILKLGYDTADNQLGFKKIQFGNYNSGYSIRYANLDGSDMHVVSVPKQPNCDRVYLKFATQAVLNLEPKEDNWDLLFTVYSVYFYKEQLPYKVVGVLTNPARSQAYLMDSTSDFTKIAKSDVQPQRFTARRDGVGYEWKQYEFGSFTIKPQFNYIVKTDNRYFKLRILDFYAPDGSKGYPKFEYVELL